MVQITVTDLQNPQRQPVLINPVLENTLYTTSSAPTQCLGSPSIIGSFKSNATPDAYLDTIKLNSTVTNLKNFRESLIRSSADTLTSLPANDSITSVKQYLNDINTRVLPYYRLVDTCIKESKEARWDEWNKQKEDTSESKERYESVMHPELKVSYYEGWFPIFRPMKETNIFALFTIGTFLILFSLAFFLRMGGVEFNIQLPFKFGMGDFFVRNRPYILSIGITSIIFSIVIVILGTSRGWFSKEDA